jgi:hypothetical protein
MFPATSVGDDSGVAVRVGAEDVEGEACSADGSVVQAASTAQAATATDRVRALRRPVLTGRRYGAQPASARASIA